MANCIRHYTGIFQPANLKFSKLANFGAGRGWRSHYLRFTKPLLYQRELHRHSKSHHIYASDWDQLQPHHIFMAIFTPLALRVFPQLFGSWVSVLSHLSASCRQGSLSFRCALCDRTLTCTSSSFLWTRHSKMAYGWQLHHTKQSLKHQAHWVWLPICIDMMMKKHKTHVCLSNALPIELQVKYLCGPPGRTRTSNPLIPLAC